jgi:acetolactate synthase-1/2/3 large subunit
MSRVIESLTASEVVVDALAAHGIFEYFVVAGGMIAPMMDAVGSHPTANLHVVYHELSAGHAAMGYARIAHRPAVALVTAGPGVLNLITAVASAFLDSTPMIVIVGQVQSYLQKRDRKVRQWAIQECSAAEDLARFTKKAITVEPHTDVIRAIQDCIGAATTGRPGPALMEFPFDLQNKPHKKEPQQASQSGPDRGPPLDLTACTAFLQAERPLIIAGGGVMLADAGNEVRTLAEMNNIPIVSTVNGLGVLPSSHSLNRGMIGSHGAISANQAFVESSSVLVLGSRLDQAVTGADLKPWKAKQPLVQVDLDSAELGARVRCEKVCGDLKEAVRSLLTHPTTRGQSWISGRAPLASERYGEGLAVQAMSKIGQCSKFASAIFADAGLHTWWAARHLTLFEGQRLIATTGTWTMGTAIPAAFGAVVARRGTYVAIVGDGCLLMQMHELQTVARESLALKIVVFNNGVLGMVRQFQQEYFGARFFGTAWGYSAPSFQRVAKAFGIDSCAVSNANELDQAIELMWANPSSPFLLEILIPPDESITPVVPFGGSLAKMTP